MKTVELRPRAPNLTLARVVREGIEGTSWNRARDLVRSGRVFVDGSRATEPEARVPESALVTVQPTAPRQRKGVLVPEAIVHMDADVVVVNKPAGMLSVPYEPTDRDTLVDVTRAALRRRGPKGYAPELGVVHRIDIDTTGLLVFTRTLDAKRHLAQQFREHSVHRRYLAIVHGAFRDATFDTVLLQNRGDGLRGSVGHFRPARGAPPADARRAVTHARRIALLRDASLVECMLETGRQHQIRIHLSEAGHPLVGERVYIRDYAAPLLEAPRPMLHATELGFEHPRTGESMQFAVPAPPDFAATLAGLRRGAKDA